MVDLKVYLPDSSLSFALAMRMQAAATGWKNGPGESMNFRKPARNCLFVDGKIDQGVAGVKKTRGHWALCIHLPRIAIDLSLPREPLGLWFIDFTSVRSLRRLCQSFGLFVSARSFA